MIVKQILLVSTLENVLRTVWRICILMLGCKGLTNRFHAVRLFSCGSQMTSRFCENKKVAHEAQTSVTTF